MPSLTRPIRTGPQGCAGFWQPSVFIAPLLFDPSMSAPRRSGRPGARQAGSGDGQPARERGQQTQGGPLGGAAHFRRKAARPEARQCGSGDGQPERDKSQAQTQGGPLVGEAWHRHRAVSVRRWTSGTRQESGTDAGRPAWWRGPFQTQGSPPRSKAVWLRRWTTGTRQEPSTDARRPAGSRSLAQTQSSLAQPMDKVNETGAEHRRKAVRWLARPSTDTMRNTQQQGTKIR